MTVLGKTLWNDEVDYEEIKKQLYVASFGAEKYNEMCDYFGAIREAFYLGNIRSQYPTSREEFAQKLKKAIEKMEAMIPTAKANSNSENDVCRKKSWLLVHHHARIYVLLAKSILEHISGDLEASKALRQSSFYTAWECEDEIQDAFDCHFYELVARARINLDGILNVVETRNPFEENN
jgi:hypothetical protein